jgi:hypothetical protein
MKKVSLPTSYLLFTAIIFLNLFGAFLNECLGSIGIPPLITPIKTLASLSVLFLIPLDKKNIMAILNLLFFGFTYIIIGLIQNRFLPSLYFVRLYLEPLIILLWISSFLNESNYADLLKITIKIFLLFALTGIVTFFLINWSSALSFLLTNETFITPDWHITYTTIIRSGLPVGDPNKTGFIEIGVLGLLTLKYADVKEYISKKTLWIIITLTGINLFLSFSKSAIGGFLIFFLIYQLKGFEIKKILGLVLAFILLGFFFYLIIPETEVTAISKWIETVSNFEDSSSQGHLVSFNKGLDLIKDNWFIGTEKGTWGTKSRLFPDNLGNVESSVLLLVIDLGLLGCLLYFYFIFSSIIDVGRINKKVIFFLILIFPPLLVLPMIQELEAILIIYTLMAFIKYKNDE